MLSDFIFSCEPPILSEVKKFEQYEKTTLSVLIETIQNRKTQIWKRVVLICKHSKKQFENGENQ